MDEREMHARCPSCAYAGAACLAGHRLAFTRRSARTTYFELACALLLVQVVLWSVVLLVG